MIDCELSDELSEYATRELADTWDNFDLGYDAFRMATLEEAEAIGFADDDGTLIIRRESDGSLFAAQVTARMVPLLSPAAREQAAAALPGDCCWVLWRPCGCPCGVTTGRRGEDLVTATEDEAWRLLYDDWGLAESDKADGYRAELMTFARYSDEVSARMLARCTRQPEPAGQATLPDEAESAVRAQLAATEVTHLSPCEGHGLMPCCGLTPFEVPRYHRMTEDPALVTCAQSARNSGTENADAQE